MDTVVAFAQWLVETIAQWGYAGIFVLMALESTFVPVPSEFVMAPAGYLVSRHELDFTLVVLAGTAGSVVGALLNYALAFTLGRAFVERWGRYIGLPPAKFERVEAFFLRHGEFGTFVGRLVLGVRHFISFPPGLARMHLGRFVFYTAAGAAIWCTILTWLGWVVGSNQELFHRYLHSATLATLGVCALLVAGYVWWQRRRASAKPPREGGAPP